MSLRPIDAVSLLPRISDASRIQAQAQNQTALFLHDATLQGAQRAVRDAQLVSPKTEAEQAGIHGEGRGNKNGQERRRTDKPKAQPSPKGKGPGACGHRLDVKL